jgi:hypothetical protein
MAEEKEKPILLVRRDPQNGKLAYKLPGKGSKWRGGFDDMSAVAQDAMKVLEPPWINEFVENGENGD